jgi:phospholipid/cholesterol/gamma-HCH transport system substrate-binding protein
MAITKGDLKVGLFVLLGLVLTALVIFLIGDERRLFVSSVTFHTKFGDVQGLNRGAPVRMGGVRIGSVSSVSYSDDSGDPTVYVVLSVVASEAPRIKTDSVVTIDNKGFLGDKMLSITKGAKGTPIPPGDWIPSEEPADMLGVVNRVASKAESAIVSFDEVMQALADEELHENLRGVVRSLNAAMFQVTDGKGYPHRLLTDPNEADRISRTLDNLDQSSEQLKGLLSEAQLAVHQVRTGPGFAHQVLYGDGPTKEIAQVGQAAEEIAVTLREIRKSDSFAHDLLYGGKGEGAGALADLGKVAADLRDIVRDMKAGKGTIGALLVDPSVYEDLKRVLGNVERNDVLRSIVRYSIKQDEKPPVVEVRPKP